MKVHVTALLLFFFAALVSLPMLACGSAEQDSGSPRATSSPGALVAEGRDRAQACTGCHGADLAGGVTPAAGDLFAPNLTPDPDTGLGAWSDDQIVTAIRAGKDDQGQDLCAVMPRFATLDDAGSAALVAYLRSLDPVANQVPSGDCPEH